MAIISRSQISSLPGNLRQVLTEIADAIDVVQARTATAAAVSAGALLKAPPFAAFNVVGSDGYFLVEITNPGDIKPATVTQLQRQVSQPVPVAGAALYHQVQSCATADFNDPTTLETYGTESGSVDLKYTIQKPGTRRFWRMRSKYSGGTWTRWVHFLDPSQCGIVSVWSGRLRSTSRQPRAVINQTNHASVTSVADGASCRILVDGVGGPGSEWDGTIGKTKVGPFPAGILTGYAYGTHYTVLYDEEGNIFRVFDDTEYEDSLADEYRLVGDLTTLSAGSTAASAIAIVSGGVVIAVSVTSHGSGYVSPPTVTFTGGGGSGATAYATINSAGEVISVTVSNGGSGYTSAPAISFNGGTDSIDGGGGSDGEPLPLIPRGR